MSSGKADVIVLGAGIVGVSAALHLQARGRDAVIVDRLGAAAGETSYGNTGVIQSEAVFPYMFPRRAGEILNAALNRDPRAHIRYGSLPAIAPWVWRYFLASTIEDEARKRAGSAALRAALHRRARGFRRAGGRGGPVAQERLDQGVPHRAWASDRARGSRGDAPLRRRFRHSRSSEASDAGAPSPGGADRRRAFHRSADHVRPRRARQRLCRTLQKPRRASYRWRRAFSGSFGGGMGGGDERGAC